MASEIVMPRMGLTMETGTIVRWLKQEGEAVSIGEPLLEIETDKATVEIEALESGRLGKIVAGVGAEVLVGGVIAYLAGIDEVADRPVPAAITPPIKVHPLAAPSDGKVRASPAARRLAKDRGIDLAAIRGSGPNGRVVAWDVTDAAPALPREESPQPARISPVAQRVAAERGVDLGGVQGSGPGGSITRRDVELAAEQRLPEPAAEPSTVAPFTRLQRVMAERMAHSFTTAPHFYLHTDVDARQLVALRQQLLPRLEQSDGVRLTFTDLLVYFCGQVLPRHPLVMRQWTPDGLRQFHQVHVGIAVETDSGLLVPVLRDVDRLGLVEIARLRSDLVARARSGKLLPSEFEQGVFTLTNLGMYRVDSFDAILNPSQAAILAVGQIRERALVENGQIIAAPVLTLSLSVDHRVLDGARAARFLSDLAEMIELPALSMR